MFSHIVHMVSIFSGCVQTKILRNINIFGHNNLYFNLSYFLLKEKILNDEQEKMKSFFMNPIN